MKYLPLRGFEDVTAALNFDTPDCHVVGGCDLYTTKAAGSDKKLYKSIENSLESQHESLLRLSASLSPPQAESLAPSLNLSRSSPFGPLSQISSRRTFAYLIATLNASHPDYDFSGILRPSDFRKERSLRSVANTVDTTIANLRPRGGGTFLTVPATGAGHTISSQTWGPRMWRVIDNEMTLKECSIYCYQPEEDPFDGEEGAIWSLNYFFFNKNRKRVCYLYLRGMSALSHSPYSRMVYKKRSAAQSSGVSLGDSSRKRARYWLGDRADAEDVESGWGEDEEDDLMAEDMAYDDLDLDDESASTDDEDLIRHREKSAVRGMSEHIAESMEV